MRSSVPQRLARAAVNVRHVGRGEIKALTGLRLVAAMWVLLAHFENVLHPYLEYVPMVRPILSAGWLGVELFFVLSGFVIARSYIEEVGTRFSLGRAADFLYNRFARVWPAWALVTTLMGAWIWTLRAQGLNADAAVPHPVADLPTYLRQLSMTQMWGNDSIVTGNYVLPGWSISAEWLAYLAFPGLAVLLLPLRRVHPIAPLVLATMAMTPLAVIAYQQGITDVHPSWLLRIACSFTAGMLVGISLLGVRSTKIVERVARAGAVTSIALVVLNCFWASWRAAGDRTLDYNGVSVLLFPALIASLALTPRGPAGFLSRPPLVYGGRISYCLYLVHFPVYDVLHTVLWQDPRNFGVVSPGLALVMPLVVLACILAAMGLHHGVEQPARLALLRARSTVQSRLPRSGRLVHGQPPRPPRAVASARDRDLLPVGNVRRPRSGTAVPAQSGPVEDVVGQDGPVGRVTVRPRA